MKKLIEFPQKNPGVLVAVCLGFGIPNLFLSYVPYSKGELLNACDTVVHSLLIIFVGIFIGWESGFFQRVRKACQDRWMKLGLLV